MPAEDIHIIEQTLQIELIDRSEFERLYYAEIDPIDKLALIADMCRLNTINMVKRAGSGHLGSSLSAMDIVVLLYYDIMNTMRLGIDNPGRDIYFSSKGHDVPGQYSVLYSLGVLPQQKILSLRRFGGLDGHPDKNIAGIEANSGSLGMGISKGKGMALAKRITGAGGRVFVLTGDGEWQEGQNYEALQSAAHHQVDNLIVIMDHNKLQSDKPVSEIIDLGDLDAKFRTFGWHVARCDGHDLRQMKQILREFDAIPGKPKLLIADTIKGRGISFMEHPQALLDSNGLYPWHAGAPADIPFMQANAELIERIQQRLTRLQLEPVLLTSIDPEPKSASGVSPEYVSQAYGDALTELGKTRRDLVVLDADLAADCKLRGFEAAFPERFIEIGIAEQDMVSTAGGLADHGLLPVVNSFASFLASRANEQIYNNATEHSKIIYACHFAGLLPAGPGKSHQSLRDISLFGALPNMVILQPCNAEETRQIVDYCVNTAQDNCMIRLVIGPSPRLLVLPTSYKLTYGQGITVHEGKVAVLFAYGPVMLHEALLAADKLAEQGFGLQVVNMPWLNRVDADWLVQTVGQHRRLFVLEDHAPVGGLRDALLPVLADTGLLAQGLTVEQIAVEGFPACGTPAEALRYHRMDGASLAQRIQSEC